MEQKTRTLFTISQTFFVLLLLTIIYARVCLSHNLNKYLTDPAALAFLDTIAYAEGTMQPDGYKLIYGKHHFNDFTSHPNCTICRTYNKKQLCSTAAGRYQFLYKTWKPIAKALNLDDFSPQSQDLAALYILESNGTIKLIKKWKIASALKNNRNMWAALPGSPYKQPTHKKKKLCDFFKKRLLYHKKRLRKRGRKL